MLYIEQIRAREWAAVGGLLLLWFLPFIHTHAKTARNPLFYFQYYNKVFFFPLNCKNDRLVGTAGAGCSWRVHFPKQEYWWWFARIRGYTDLYIRFYLWMSVCLWMHRGCRKIAGGLFSEIPLACPHPGFIFQIFSVLQCPWLSTAQEARSLACWACYKNTANDEPCTKSS